MAHQIIRNNARIEKPNALRTKFWQMWPVASIAVVAVVVSHSQLALQLGTPYLLGVPGVALALGLEVAEPGRAVPRVVRT